MNNNFIKIGPSSLFQNNQPLNVNNNNVNNNNVYDKSVVLEPQVHHQTSINHLQPTREEEQLTLPEIKLVPRDTKLNYQLQASRENQASRETEVSNETQLINDPQLLHENTLPYTIHSTAPNFKVSKLGENQSDVPVIPVFSIIEKVEIPTNECDQNHSTYNLGTFLERKLQPNVYLFPFGFFVY